ALRDGFVVVTGGLGGIGRLLTAFRRERASAAPPFVPRTYTFVAAFHPAAGWWNPRVRDRMPA
ncbi:hypothetical protein, partial [Streptomyces sp. NPDC057199]|uniref:hypothetical protein n=1 Tax=Streptomyces sp. NPDC057199 TaxID=3346047 RepID=UPI0036445D62